MARGNDRVLGGVVALGRQEGEKKVKRRGAKAGRNRKGAQWKCSMRGGVAASVVCAERRRRVPRGGG